LFTKETADFSMELRRFVLDFHERKSWPRLLDLIVDILTASLRENFIAENRDKT
jgi:hypothetical protein